MPSKNQHVHGLERVDESLRRVAVDVCGGQPQPLHRCLCRGLHDRAVRAGEAADERQRAAVKAQVVAGERRTPPVAEERALAERRQHRRRARQDEVGSTNKWVAHV